MQIMREFEGHLRTVAAERDAALEQLEGVDARLEEAAQRLKEAERKEVGGGGEGGGKEAGVGTNWRAMDLAAAVVINAGMAVRNCKSLALECV